MESKLNKLLARQIRKNFGSVENVPEELKGILSDINNTYEYFEDDIRLLQNSIEISSQELRTAFQKHKQDAEEQKETLDKINEAIQAIKPSSHEIVIEATSSDSRQLVDSLIHLIEEKKQAEAEILKLSIAVEQNPASIVITDIKGNIEYVNPKFCDLTGYTKEEIIGKNPNILKAEDSNPEFYKDLWSTILSGNEWKGEFHNRKKNGELYWELASISAVKNQNGEIINFLAIKEDITERRKAEEALQTKTSLLEAQTDATIDGILVVDQNQKRVLINKRAIDLFEIPQHILDDEDDTILLKHVVGLTKYPEKFIEKVLYLYDKNTEISQEEIEFKNGMVLDRYSAPVLGNDGRNYGRIWTFRDITERKHAEATLQNERTLFRTIIDLIPVAVYVKDLQGRKIIANPKEVQIAGLNSEDEVISKTDFDLFPTDQAIRSKKEDEFVLQSGKPILNFESTITDKEGKTHSLLGSKVPLYDMYGMITGIVGVSHDITERKQAENELQAAHKSLSDILNAAIHNSIITTDVNGIIKVFSKGAEKMLGYSAQEIVGKKTPAIFHLESEVLERANELSIEFGRTIAGFDVFVAKAKNQEHEERIWTYRRKDGTLFYVTLIVTAIKNINDEVIGFLGIASDITERKKAEEEVKRVSTRLALATSAGGVGVWDLDIENNTLVWDDQMFALYGVEKNEFTNVYDTWLKGVHPEDKERADKEIQMAINGEKEFDIEFRVCWPDGSIHTIRALANIQFETSSNTHHMIGTNWDITEQKKTEAILLKARQEAEMANKAKSVFLANMSHEIRTPLNAIIGFSQLMSRDKHLNDLQKEYNVSIIRAGEHLLSLINDILELSKMEAGRLELNPQNIDLHLLFADIQMLFKQPAQTKHLQFNFEAADNIPQFVIVDDNKLRRIFINLIGNAIKFTDEGSISIRAQIDKTDDNKSKLIIEIHDSGHGIAEAELDKLFKHFVQTSSGIKNSSGTGLGLALSRELAILMGGDITVVSEIGKGSVFTFSVEIQEGQEVLNQNNFRNRVIGLEKPIEEYRILVVDDTAENLQVVVSLLNQVGFKTQEAINGEEAIIKADEWNPHLILMDMRMPVLDGYEATRRIKSTPKGAQIPIVALTASSFEDERKKIREIGMVGYIRKPFSENELFGTIGNILGINYIFDKNEDSEEGGYPLNEDELMENIANISPQIIREMKDAIDVADVDQLIEIINRIEPENKNLANYLLALANNYDYEYLQQLINNKETD